MRRGGGDKGKGLTSSSIPRNFTRRLNINNVQATLQPGLYQWMHLMGFWLT